MKTIFGGRKQRTELLYLWLSKLARAKVLLKLEFDTEDQVLLIFILGLVMSNDCVGLTTVTMDWGRGGMNTCFYSPGVLSDWHGRG